MTEPGWTERTAVAPAEAPSRLRPVWMQGRSCRQAPPEAQFGLELSPAWLALRIYHVWCMLVGLCIAVLVVMEAFLGLYVSLFSSPWVSGSKGESMQIGAACLLSTMLLTWGSALCHAGVQLVFDAARQDSFRVFRALFRMESINSRNGLPACGLEPERTKWEVRCDCLVQCLLLYGPLDLLPLLVSLCTGVAMDWVVWISWVAFIEVCLFWVLVCINDYVGKVRGLCQLFSDEPEPGLLPPPIPDVAAGRSPVSLEVEDEDDRPPEMNLCIAGCTWLHNQSTWVALLGLLVLAVVTVFVRSAITVVGSLLLIIFSILHLLQRHCVPGRSLERCVQIRSEEEREQLVSTLDSELRLTSDMEMTSQTGVHLKLPAGAQLVDDVGGIKPGMLGYLSSAPVGSAVAFRLQPLTRWNVFLETHCGGSPDQIIQGSLIWLVCGAVICLALFFTRHYLEGLCGLVLLALLTAPAVCLMVFPQRARFCHAFISLFLALMAFVLTACASRRPALLLWSAAALGVGSHWLLPRKLHHMGRVSLLFTLVFAAVGSCLISISFGALVKGELEPPHFEKGTFQFPSKGHMTDWGVENFTAAPCTIFYGTTDWQSPLALVDFALFNKLVYLPDEPLRKYLQEWLPGWELAQEQRREQPCTSPDEDCDSGDWTSWFVFQGVANTTLEKTTVVTIRGTKTDLDFIMDLDFWSGALMIQVMSNVLLTGPPVRAFLHSAIAKWWFKGKKAHYASVAQFLRNQHMDDRVIYITGHSLGGGIANLLGAEFGIPSIAFSPPGVQSTARLLEIEPSRLQALALDVEPDGDPVVSAAGAHGTVQLPIGCADKGPQCHRIFNHACELFDMCGDQANQRRALPCDFCPAKLWQRKRLAPQCPRHPPRNPERFLKG